MCNKPFWIQWKHYFRIEIYLVLTRDCGWKITTAPHPGLNCRAGSHECPISRSLSVSLTPTGRIYAAAVSLIRLLLLLQHELYCQIFIGDSWKLYLMSYFRKTSHCNVLLFKQIFPRLHNLGLVSGTCIHMEGQGAWPDRERWQPKTEPLDGLAASLFITKRWNLLYDSFETCTSHKNKCNVIERRVVVIDQRETWLSPLF